MGAGLVELTATVNNLLDRTGHERDQDEGDGDRDDADGDRGQLSVGVEGHESALEGRDERRVEGHGLARLPRRRCQSEDFADRQEHVDAFLELRQADDEDGCSIS